MQNKIENNFLIFKVQLFELCDTFIDIKLGFFCLIQSVMNNPCVLKKSKWFLKILNLSGGLWNLDRIGVDLQKFMSCLLHTYILSHQKW